MSPPPPRLVRLGEAAWTVVLGETIDRKVHREVLELAHAIGAAEIPGVLEVVPAYCTLSVFFDPGIAPAAEVRAQLSHLTLPTTRPPAHPAARLSALHTIPVSYSGPDLDEVCHRTGLSRDEVVHRHATVEYFVYLLGFVPGFAYLGDLDPALVLPRRAAPRTRVPAGSVAIAGAQTAVYPLDTPGGWHLIGRTDAVLFDPAREPAALLAAGDRIRFEPVA